jgi:hypothetical protein
MGFGGLAENFLAFVTAAGPIGAAVWVLVPIIGIWVAGFATARVRRPQARRKSFDVGGRFDQFYGAAMPRLKSGAVTLIYAGYATLWLGAWPVDPDLPWLHLPWDSDIAGGIAMAVIAGLLIYAATELLKALWFGLRWLRLEGMGMRWHVSDNGDAYRIVWLRPSGEYLFDNTIRDHRMQQELTAIRERKKRFASSLAGTAISLVVWLIAPRLLGQTYDWLSPDIVATLNQWDALSLLSWLLFLFFVIPKAAGLIAALADELVYRSGAQFIPGAKVLGSRPVPLGRKQVETQKAHGNADFETAAEAIRRMAGQSEQ